MEEEKGRGPRAHTPFDPVRQPCSLQDLPSRAEELEFGSDTISIPPECSIDIQNSPLSSPISDKKSTRSESATWDLPIPAVLPLPGNVYPDIEGVQWGQDLPAELQKPQSGYTDAIISRRGSWHDGRQFWISTPSLGVMLESARTTSSALSSFHLHSSFGCPDLIRPDIACNGELEEKVIKPDVPSFHLHKAPSLCLHKSISDPGLGARLRATKALSVLHWPFLETSPSRNVQEKLPQCVNTNISSGVTKDPSSRDTRDCPSTKDEIPETPGIPVVNPSNASENASFHEQANRNEKVLELPNSPPKCDETLTEGAIDESAQQRGKHDESPSNRPEESRTEDSQERSTETEQELSAVHVGQPAPDDPPCNSTPLYETNVSTASVDDVVHDFSKEVSVRRPKKILRRVPVAPGRPSEKVVKNDSQVNSGTSSPFNSPRGAKCLDSGAGQAQAHAGKSDGVAACRQQSSNETLQGHNKAKTGLGADINIGAGSEGGSGTIINNTSNGTGAGAGTTTSVAISGRHHCSEVGASRADTVPASPRSNRKFPPAFPL